MWSYFYTLCIIQWLQYVKCQGERSHYSIGKQANIMKLTHIGDKTYHTLIHTGSVQSMTAKAFYFAKESKVQNEHDLFWGRALVDSFFFDSRQEPRYLWSLPSNRWEPLILSQKCSLHWKLILWPTIYTNNSKQISWQ